MNRYQDMIRKAERCTRAAHRATDEGVKILWYKAAQTLERKAKEYMIADAEPLTGKIMYCKPVNNGRIARRKGK